MASSSSLTRPKIFSSYAGKRMPSMHPREDISDENIEVAVDQNVTVKRKFTDLAGSQRKESTLKYPLDDTSPATTSGFDRDDCISFASGRTFSDASLTKRSKCHVCGNAFSSVSPAVYQCTTCPRQYHKRCQQNSKLRVHEPSRWQCKRCVKKQVHLDRHASIRLTSLHDPSLQSKAQSGTVPLSKSPADPRHLVSESRRFPNVARVENHLSQGDKQHKQHAYPPQAQQTTGFATSLTRNSNADTSHAQNSALNVSTGNALAVRKLPSKSRKINFTQSLSGGYKATEHVAKRARQSVKSVSKSTHIHGDHYCRHCLSGLQGTQPTFCAKCGSDFLPAETSDEMNTNESRLAKEITHLPSRGQAVGGAAPEMLGLGVVHGHDGTPSLTNQKDAFRSDLSASFDRKAKIREISQRPRRKEMSRMSVLYSPLGHVNVLERQQRSASDREALDTGYLEIPTMQHRGKSAPNIGLDGMTATECTNREEFLGLRDDLLLTLHDGKLCYRDNRRNNSGSLSRKTLLYSTEL